MKGSCDCQYVILTPAGRAAVATVAVLGSDALRVVGDCFVARSGRPLAHVPLNRIVVGHWCRKGAAEASYGATGEEVVVCRRAADQIEIHCHGGPTPTQVLVGTLEWAGCRPMPWPRWTAMMASDPLQAEAHEALAHALTERTAQVLLDQFHGSLRRAAKQVRRGLQCPRKKRPDIPAAREAVEALLARADIGRHLTEPWRIVIAGPANVGKSTLANALLGYPRSIVYDQPGTTRDAVTGLTAVDGWPICLVDTAGLHEAASVLEAMGMARTQREIEEADRVLLVFDGTRAWSAECQGLVDRYPHALRVFTKGDQRLPCETDRPDGILVSGLTGLGLEELLAAVAASLVPVVPAPGTPVPFRDRHVAWLEAARYGLMTGDVDRAGQCLTALTRGEPTATISPNR